jgi:putative membrane protein
MKPTMNQVIFIVSIWVVTFVACADDQAPLTSQQFVWEAGTAGMQEVYLGQVALDKSQDPAVRSFAKHMVRDHSSTGNKLMGIANNEALDFPPTNLFSVVVTNSSDLSSNAQAAPFNSSAGIGTNNMKGAEQLMVTTQSATNDAFIAIRQLVALPEPQFDQAYARQMVQDHVAAIHLFEQATNDVPDKDLKKFATKTLPVLNKHYEMAQDLENKLSGAQGTNASSMDQNDTMTSSMGTPP